MKRRDLIRLAVGTALAPPLRAFAQAPAKVYRIGLLGFAKGSPFEVPLMQGLARHGYVVDKNLTIERRAPSALAELVASQPDAIIAGGYAAAVAVKQGTTLPSVVFSAGDPVGIGLVESLARPGGHLTGVSDVSVEVTPKRLELLKEFAPKLRRVAMLWNADDPAMTLRYRASEAGAKALDINVQALGVREPADFDQAFSAMVQDMPDAILMVSDPLTNLNRKRVFEFATVHRLPGIYEYDFIVRDGGLMSYGIDLDEAFDRVGDLVDRILKGAKPSDLPFEQPTRFRFALNLTAAKAIGVEPSASLLARADEVIE
ncbi:MAG TPA: ABC transporter substrate-binding protein [Stellaceae bacterium]|nr:ABC transporter substrate-binding protein [Stellaceae bacterium]